MRRTTISELKAIRAATGCGLADALNALGRLDAATGRSERQASVHYRAGYTAHLREAIQRDRDEAVRRAWDEYHRRMDKLDGLEPRPF